MQDLKKTKEDINPHKAQLLKKIKHDTSEEYGRHEWNLTSEDGPEIAFGMYFFVVEAKGIGVKRGKFAVIK